MVFGGMNDVDTLGAGVEEWARGVTAASHTGWLPVDMIPEETGEEEFDGQDDGGLASDIEAARKASLAFSTKLSKQRIRKKRSRKHYRKGESTVATDDDEDDRRSHARSEQPGGARPEAYRTGRSAEKPAPKGPAATGTRGATRHTMVVSSADAPPRAADIVGIGGTTRKKPPDVPAMPEVIGSDDESFFRPAPPLPKIDISAPILNPDPFPVLLQPTIYDPSAKTGAVVGVSATGSDDGLSAVQRSIEAELLAEAEEAAARTSALKRAKEAVLSKLSREFCRRKGGSSAGKRFGRRCRRLVHAESGGELAAGQRPQWLRTLDGNAPSRGSLWPQCRKCGQYDHHAGPSQPGEPERACAIDV